MALQYESIARQLLTLSQQLAELKCTVSGFRSDLQTIQAAVCLTDEDDEWQEDMDEDSAGSGSDTEPLDEKDQLSGSIKSKLFVQGGAKARKLCDK